MTDAEQIRILKQCIADDTENEEMAKQIALRVLPHIDVYGNSYGVPTIADVVEALVKIIESKDK